MDGIHDLGGVEGFGPVEKEAREPVFHDQWERRVFGMAAVASLRGLTSTDEFRHAIERMDPLHYLRSSYYEHWLTGLTTLLAEKQIVKPSELDLDPMLARPVQADAGWPEAARPAVPFAVGDAVRVRDIHPRGHTRCPRYVRGRRGAVVRVDEEAALPDDAAHGADARREPAYSVRFDARELWGARADASACVCVDLWQSYLEPAA